MGTMGVVVVDVVAEKPLEMPSSENERPVQTLRTHRFHPSLGERVRLRGANRCEDHLDTLGSEDLVEGAGELGIAVADQEAQGEVSLGEAEGEVPRLLGDPGRIGVPRYPCQVHSAGVHLDEEEDIERP